MSAVFITELRRLARKLFESFLYALLVPSIFLTASITRGRKSAGLKKILLIPEFSTTGGGTRTYLFRLLEFLGDNEFETTILVPRRQRDMEVEHACLERNIELLTFPRLPGWLEKKRHAFLFNILYDVVCVARASRGRKPDCIIVSSGSIGEFAGLFLYPSRLIYILHTCPASRQDGLLSLAIRVGAGRRKRLLTVSNFALSRTLEHWLPDKGKRRYAAFIYNAAPVVDSATKGSAGAADPLMVLTMGHLVEYKNPRLWIRVAKRIIDRAAPGSVRFVWLGSGPLIDECRSSVRDGYLRSIEFLGDCSDVASFLERTAVYAQPSKLENHSFAVIEAMAHGIPCVVSDAGGLPESIEDGRSGYIVDVRDEETVVRKIETLLRDDRLRQTMGAEAYRRCGELFSLESWEARMKDLMTSLI